MSTLALRAGRLQFFLATILRAVSGGIGLAPNELCGTYEAPACAELTANNSIFLGTRQTLKPNGTFIEEGALALGRCRRSGETGEASIVHYRLSGSFRDHGADTRHKDVNVRKLVIDIQGVVVMPLPGSSALDSWRKVCPCGGRSWKPLEEVDVLSRCGDTCEPFLARSLYLLYSTNEEHSLCISPRRSFDERWPLRQKLTTCLSKESHMECWRREPRRRTTFSPEVTHDRAHFLHMRVPADPLADLQITAIAADVFMKEDGTYSEEMSWVFGQLQQKVHLRTFAAGRWHHHGEHTFVPGMAKLRLELSEVIAHPQTSQVCLEEGCAPPGVILRLICPCGPRVWASDGHAGQDLLQCPSSSCSLSSFFPMESFLLGGRHPNGTMCLSVKNPSRFHGWGMNSSNLLSCSGDASHQETWLPEDDSTEEERLEERTTTSTTALSSSIRAGMDGDPDKSKHDKRMSSDSMRRYPRTFTSPSHDKPDQIQEEQSKVRSHEHAHDHSQAFASSSDGVTAFEEVGLSGKKHFLGVGRHPAKSLPFAAVRSLQIPAGWHVVVLAPLKMQNGRIISDAAQLIRALVFDVVNLTKRIDTARPWVGADGMPALMQQLQFEVRKLDSSNLRGARLSTVACGESDHATADSRLLSLFGEASETFQVHDTLQHWQSISVDHGFRLTVDAKRGEAAMIDIIGSPGLNASCANFTKPPKVIELEPDCSDLDQCSGHGICRRPQECVCRMMEGWIGKSCNLQVPDRTTAVVCNSVLAFVGAPLDCFIHVRRHYEPILAASEVLSVTLSDPLLGDLKLEDPAPNATSIKFTFWPRRSWQEPVRLLSMRTPYDYLADLSQAFATHIQASLAPSLSSSCEIRPEMDDGNYRCSFDFHQRGSKQPLPIPSKLLSVMVDGGVVSKLMCAGLRPQSGTLCSRLIADVEVYESKARLTAKLQPPISNAMEASAVAHDEIELHGPARTCTPSMLSSIGLPSHLSQRLCISSLQLACVGPAPNATLGPRMQLQLAEEALSAGDARAALQAALSALRGAKTCITYLSTTNTQNLEIMLRSFGIRATVDWQLTGHTQSANDVAVSCVRYARGDRDTEVWSSRCRKTLIAFGVVKNAVDVVNVVFDAHPWDDVLHDRSGVAHFAPSLSAVSKAIAMLPTSWQHGLDADGTEEARRWTMELSIAGCLARAESAKTERNQTLAMNLTLGSCATALSILEVAMKRWMPVTAFKASVVTWQIRIYIIRAEILFAAEEYKQAMREVMKALGLPNADEALDHDRVTDLLRRIVRARSETHGGTGGSGSSWDFSEDENDQETSYYEILGVERNATDAEVKRAYRQLALKWHPDKHTDDKEKAEAMFISITEAYEYIIADTERQRRSGQPQAPPKGHMSEESTTEEENVDEETRETDSDEGDAQKDNEAENRKSDSSHEDEGSGHSWDPLSRVALPRHCCLPAPRR